MSGSPEAIEGVSGASEVRLADVTVPHSESAGASRAMSIAVENAIDRATALPGADHGRHDIYAELTDKVSSPGAMERQQLLSSVERDGATPAPVDDTETMEVVAESLTSLMREMTTWQVTWGMAQTAQKDVSHVLKSS